MKTPVGFKGRYFRLTAIAALAGDLKAHAVQTSTRRIVREGRREAQEEEEDPGGGELLPGVELYASVAARFSRKPCHCNCFFRRKFKRLSYLYKFIVRPPRRYVKTKTGTSPPTFLLS